MPKHIIALVIAALLPAVALAGGYSVPNVSPRDLAMASAAVSVSLNARRQARSSHARRTRRTPAVRGQ